MECSCIQHLLRPRLTKLTLGEVVAPALLGDVLLLNSSLLLQPCEVGRAWLVVWGPGLGAVAVTQLRADLPAPRRGCARCHPWLALESGGLGLERRPVIS